jgi:hypothetical protein
MSKQFLAALAIVGTALTGAAQEKPATPAPTQPTAAPNVNRQVPLRVQITLLRFQGEKRISSVPYMLGVLSNSAKTSLRMGIQVPVINTVFGKSDGAMVPASSYNYRDIGTNIDCQAQDVGNGLYQLAITVTDSSIHVDAAGAAEQKEPKQILRDVPAFRSFNASFSMVLRDGQTMQYASATDPINGEVMRIDVTLSLAK